MISKLCNLKIIRYGTVGILTNGFGYFIYAVFIYFKFSYVVASAFVFVLSMLVSFLFNSKLVFKAKKININEFIFYCIFYISLWVFGLLILHVLIKDYLMSAYLAQVVNLIISVIISFTFLNILFGRK